LSTLLVLVPLRAEEKKPADKPAGPRISVEPSDPVGKGKGFNFGPALQNKTLSKEFSIKNYGSADLVIENVSTTCGCTAALLESKVVKPGGSTPMRVTLDTRVSSGSIEKTILVRSNDPTTSLLEVKVGATVSAEKSEK
jgi:hypothetical protein